MFIRIINKQPNSRMCLVCGLKNPAGLHSRFYELENGELLALFVPRDIHQGYPGRLHGGIGATILDETIGRAIMSRHQGNIWGVTIEFSMRLKKPVPLNQELCVLGAITNKNKRFFEGVGQILLPDGTVAIEARGKYLKTELDKIADFDHQQEEWRVERRPDDPAEVELTPIGTAEQEETHQR